MCWGSFFLSLLASSLFSQGIGCLNTIGFSKQKKKTIWVEISHFDSVDNVYCYLIADLEF